MKTKIAERGSAVILAMVIVIIVVGISGAFLAELILHEKRQYGANQADEAQMICDAILEKTRRALWKYRSEERSFVSGAWKWDDMLSYCQETSGVKLPVGLGTITYPTIWKSSSEVDMEAVWGSYMTNTTSKYFTDYRAKLGSVTPPDMTGTDAPKPAVSYKPDSADGKYDEAYSSDAVFIGWSRPYGRGAYFVVVRDNDDAADDDDAIPGGYVKGTNDNLYDFDNQVIVTVVASLPEGTQRSIEALVEYPEDYFDPKAGLLSDGDINMGNGNVTNPDGTAGGGKVHTNGNLYVGANGAATEVAAVGTVTGPGGGEPPGTAGTVNDSDSGTAPPVLTIPPVDPVSYLSNPIYNANSTYPMYILSTDGSGNVIVTDVNGGSVSGVGDAWKVNKQSPATFSLADAAAYTPGVYYSSGNLELDAPGSGDVITGTFISEQSVSMSGNGQITPAIYTLDSKGDIAAATTVVAGKDITISGNSSSAEVKGVFMAGEQVALSGTVKISGSVIAKDLPNTNGGGANSDKYGADLDGNGVTIAYSKIKSLIPVGEDSVKVRNVRRMGVNK